MKFAKWALLFAVVAVFAASEACAIPRFADVKNAYAKSDALLLDRHGEVIHELRVNAKGRRLGWAALKDVSPALQRADIGVALGSGTDVAKETADIILLDNNFSTIIKAVKEGRVIYDNIKKVVFYFLSDGLAEVITVSAGILLGWPLPLLASQIIWINLIDDTFPGMAMAREPAEENIMKQRPRKLDEPILSKESKILIGAISLLSAAGTLFFFQFFWKQNHNNG